MKFGELFLVSALTTVALCDEYPADYENYEDIETATVGRYDDWINCHNSVINTLERSQRCLVKVAVDINTCSCEVVRMVGSLDPIKKFVRGERVLSDVIRNDKRFRVNRIDDGVYEIECYGEQCTSDKDLITEIWNLEGPPRYYHCNQLPVCIVNEIGNMTSNGQRTESTPAITSTDPGTVTPPQPSSTTTQDTISSTSPTVTPPEPSSKTTQDPISSTGPTVAPPEPTPSTSVTPSTPLPPYDSCEECVKLFTEVLEKLNIQAVCKDSDVKCLEKNLETINELLFKVHQPLVNDGNSCDVERYKLIKQALDTRQYTILRDTDFLTHKLNFYQKGMKNVLDILENIWGDAKTTEARRQLRALVAEADDSVPLVNPTTRRFDEDRDTYPDFPY